MNRRTQGDGGCFTSVLVGIVGLFLLGPLGLFLGPLASMIFLRPSSGDGRGGFRKLNATQDAIVVLIAAVIRADGRIMRSELDFVRIFFQRSFGEELARVALLRLRDLLKQHIDTMSACRILRMTTTEQGRVALVRVLMELSQADGIVSEAEKNVIDRIAMALGVAVGGQRGAYEGRSSYAYTQPPTDYYAVLGLTPSASNEEVKQAFRRLAIKWHPDRMGGKSEEERAEANAMLQKINEAYEKIKQSRGIK